MTHSSASHYRCWKCSEAIDFSAFKTHRCAETPATTPQQVNFTLMQRVAALEPVVASLVGRVGALESECDRLRNQLNRGFVGVRPEDYLARDPMA